MFLRLILFALSSDRAMAASMVKNLKLLHPKNVPKFDFTKHRLYLAPPFLVYDYEPVAQKTHREGRLRQKVDDALQELESCKACPRNCGVNRLKNQV